MKMSREKQTPDRSQDDMMDKDDTADVFAPSEAEDDADIADFRV